MQIGRLRHRAKIQVATETPDDFGEPDATWADFVAERWMSIQPLSGRELFTAQQIHAEVTHRIVLRYVAGVVPKMRVLFGTREFDIHEVRNIDERDIMLNLLASENV